MLLQEQVGNNQDELGCWDFDKFLYIVLQLISRGSQENRRGNRKSFPGGGSEASSQKPKGRFSHVVDKKRRILFRLVSFENENRALDHHM